MKFIGEVTVTKLDLITGKTTIVKGLNTITKRAAEATFLDDDEPFESALRIAISPDIYTPDYERTTVDNVIAIGDTAGAAGYVFTDEATPFVTYENTFPAPASSRTFSTIALVTGTTNNNTANITSDAFGYITFGSPFTQTPTDQFTIAYKVFLSFTSPTINLGTEFERSLSLQLLDQNNLIDYDHASWHWALYNPNNNFDQLRARPWREAEFTGTATENRALLKRKHSLNLTFPTNRLIFGLIGGNLDRLLSVEPGFKGVGRILEFSTGSELTPVWSHNETTDALFEDPVNKANSDWKPTIVQISSFEEIPSIFSFYIDQSGGVGAGSYVMYESYYSGGIANHEAIDNTVQWLQRPHPLVGTAAYPDFFDNDGDIPLDHKYFLPWVSDRFWVSSRKTTVAIWQVYPEFLLDDSWDLAVSDSVTRINDVAAYTDDATPANNRIYVATEEGLYEINPNAPSVTQLDSDRAMAVDVGNGGAVFAVLVNTSNVGRLTSSIVGYANAHTFSGTIDYEQVARIACDRDSADYNLGILELNPVMHPNDGSTTQGGIANNEYVQKIHFWNNTSGYDSTIDCLFRTSSTTIYWSRDLVCGHSSSFVCQQGVWMYAKHFSTFSQNNFALGGYDLDLKKAADDDAVDLLNGTGTNFVGTSLTAPRSYATGAATYGQELRHSSASSSMSATNLNRVGTPSFAVMDASQIGAGKLIACIAGFVNQGNSNTSPNASLRDRMCGIFEFDVSTVDGTPVSFSRFEEGNIDNTIYNLSMYSSSIYADACAGMMGAVHPGKNHGLFFLPSTGYSSLNSISVGVSAEASQITYSSLGVWFWGAPTKEGMFDYKGWSTRWGWNPTPGEWVIDNDGVYGGKPLHTVEEDLVKNLRVSWADQDLGNVSDLIVDQHYEFGVGSKGIISGGQIQPVTVNWSYCLRPTVPEYSVSDTVPGTPYQITLDAAPTGGSPDPLWLSLDDEEGFDVKLLIDGNPATPIYSGSPLAGEVLIQDPAAGVLEFNSTDETKAITGTILYYQKIDSTEVL